MPSLSGLLVEVKGLIRALRIRYPLKTFAAIAAACLALIGLVWLATLDRIQYERADSISDEMKENANLATAFEEQAIRIIKDIDRTLLFVRSQYHEHGGKLNIPWMLSETGIDRSVLIAVAVLDERGKLLFGDIGGTKGTIAEAEYFKVHLQQEPPLLYIGKPVVTTAKTNWVLHLSLRVDKPDGRFGGVIVATVNPECFTSFYTKADIGKLGLVALVGLDGVARAAQRGRTAHFGGALSVSELMVSQPNSDRGSFLAAGKTDGIARIMSYRVLAQYPLVILVGTAESEALTTFHRNEGNYHQIATLTSGCLVLAALALMWAVTRQKRAADKLIQSQARYRLAFDRGAVGIVHMRSDGRLLEVNPTLCKLLGYSEQELLARTFRDVIHPDDLPLSEKLLQDLFTLPPEALSPQVEKRYLRKDGTALWGLAAVALVRDDPREPGYLVAVIQDITARKRAEDARRESELRYRSLFDNMLEGFAYCQMLYTDDRADDFVYIDVNAAFGRLTGLKDVIGRKVSDVIPGLRDANPELFEIYGKVSASGKPERFESYVAALDIWFSIAVYSTEPGSFIAVFDNITERKHTESTLQQSEDRYRDLVEHSQDLICTYDLTGRLLSVNPHVAKTLGYTSEELLQADMRQFLPSALRHEFDQHLATIRRDGAAAGLMAVRTRSGERRIWEYSNTLRTEGLTAPIVRGMAHDVTARLEAERVVKIRSKQQGLIASFSKSALASRDLDELMNQVAVVIRQGLNVEFCKVLQLVPDGRSLVLKAGLGWAEDRVGQYLAQIDAGSQYRYVLDAHVPVVIADLPTDTRFKPAELLTRHGIRSAVEVPVTGLTGPFGLLGAYVREPGFFTPESVDFLCSIANTLETAVERKNSEERLAYLAQFDTLTSLPNRNLFSDRLKQILAQAERNHTLVSVMLIDIDRFQVVNDTYGHEVGDLLLQLVAHRLQECVRSGDTVARLGGDEFVFFMSNDDKADVAGTVAHKVVDIFASPFDLHGRETYVSASLGIALYPIDGEDPETLLKNASSAMYKAKELGRNSYQFYLPRMNERTAERLEQEGLLRGALERNEFLLLYQPKVNCASGQIAGFEALIRWQHPQRGLVSPCEFITLLEETGLIIPVGEWAMHTACAQAKRWHDAGLGRPSVAVNVSGRQMQPVELCETVRQALDASGLEPRYLDIELTESQLMGDVEGVISILTQLKALGVRISVDDFGTGYSSLAYLKRFPIDTLKVDQEFVKDIIADPDDVSITRAIITLAHSLNLKVVAEGVETEGQLGLLIANHCDEIQGYYFSKPLLVAAATDLLQQGRSLESRMLASRERTRTLLLVDDEENIVSALKRLLRRDGYNILSATNAAQGLELLASHPVDVIISDQRMPGMTGVEFLRRVKTLHPQTVRMVLSGYTDLQAVTDAINEGAIYKFLTKPWDDGILRANIEEAFRNWEMAEENRRLQQEVKLGSDRLASTNEDLKKLLANKAIEVQRNEASLDIAREVLQQLPWPAIGIDDENTIAFVNAAAEILCGQALLGTVMESSLPRTLIAALGSPPKGTGAVNLDGVRYQWVYRNMGNNSRSRGTLLVLSPLEITP